MNEFGFSSLDYEPQMTSVDMEAYKNFVSIDSTQSGSLASNKCIFNWLKYLRLHKYANLFTQMTYDQIVGLNDDILMRLNITLGARRKILANIQKLRGRENLLRELSNVILLEPFKFCSLFSFFFLFNYESFLLIKIFDEKDIENDKETVPKIINDLFEISLMPMRPASSPPTSLASIETIDSKATKLDDTAQKKSTDVCNLFIDLLEKSKICFSFLRFVFSNLFNFC